MKKLTTAIVVVIAIKIVSATGLSSECCQHTYQAIEMLLKNKTITIKEAQKLWIKHRDHS